MAKVNEESWVITGRRIGGLWVGWRRWRTEGETYQVGFPWKRVMQRERFSRDVIGFFHTHPNMSASPSELDVQTMQAWTEALGKNLLCVIEGKEGAVGWLFRDDRHRGDRIMRVYALGWGIILGVEHGRSSK